MLYAGVMLTAQGPKLIEYNVRFGDPECQVLMLRMMSDIVPALLAACDGQLKNFDLRWYDEPALTVVMAAKGYPGDYEQGHAHRGSRRRREGRRRRDLPRRHGGEGWRHPRQWRARAERLRLGKTVLEAQQRAYAAVDRIKWPDGFCRRDIGWQAVEQERAKG